TIAIALVLALCSACGSRHKSNTPLPDAVRSAFGPGTTSGTPGPGGSSAPGSTITPTPANVDPATGSASLQDPPGDALKVGNAPTYADIQTAEIYGRGSTIR